MNKLKPIMLGGTGSDVGKSLIATALCRIFRQDGYSPAPFKAQNMALNSFATPDGYEIGRAQAVQAEAAGIDCSTDMNPILLKPTSGRISQVVLNGIPIGNRDAYNYYNGNEREMLKNKVHESFDRLSALYNPVVMEGAGSIAEINLESTDLVNMSMARYADAAVILVADIDRGGVFASAYGSIMLQSKENRKLIKGIIVNKFRGDLQLFNSGRKMLEQICEVPVLGVLPYIDDLHIDDEDSVALSLMCDHAEPDKINVAVIRLPHISNFTDFDYLASCSGINLYYTISPEEISKADVIILPGTKSTILDLKFIKDSGIEKVVVDARKNGKVIWGICGGYQMLGRKIFDPDRIESDIERIDGLSLLPIVTIITSEKITCQRKFRLSESGNEQSGYEIHQGRSIVDNGLPPMIYYSDGMTDGCKADERCMGSYMHGLLDNMEAIDMLLKPCRLKRQLVDCRTDCQSLRDLQYDKLAMEVRNYLDMDKIYEIMRGDDRGTWR